MRYPSLEKRLNAPSLYPFIIAIVCQILIDYFSRFQLTSLILSSPCYLSHHWLHYGAFLLEECCFTILEIP